MTVEFFPVTIQFIYSFNGPLPFDVYIQRFEGKFTKIYNKNSEHDPEQIYRYENKKITNLYVAQAEKNLYGVFLYRLVEQFNRGVGEVDKEKMIDVIKTSLELTYEKFADQSDELEMNMQWASQQVKSALMLMEDNMTAAIEIFKALSEDEQLLKHSYMVSLFSLVLAKKLGITSQKNLMGIGLGALLHDLGHTRINSDLFSKHNLTPKEWDEIKDHPQLALKIVDHTKGITSDIRSILIQHHEQPNGRGYPNRLTNSNIFPPAKIVAIADAFCSFVSKAAYRETFFTPAQAIQMMRDDIGHYDAEYLEVFAIAVQPKKKAA
jgi:HD-GYP domain-containing protein (c-di-GMP phosphodiesterase class II)